MRIAICDDEFYQRHQLRNIIEQVAKELKIKIEIEQHASGEQLLKRLEEDTYRYELILLDIQMQDLTGMDVAKAIRQTNQSTMIIFITGIADYVFEGYSVQAFNYILKPIEEKKVMPILKDALKAFKVEEKPYYAIVTKDAIYNVSLDEIIYFKSDKRIIEVVTQKHTYQFYSKLDELETSLSEKGFIRCHQRYLANISFINQVKEGDMLLKTEEVIPVSRNRYKETMLAFGRRSLG